MAEANSKNSISYKLQIMKEKIENPKGNITIDEFLKQIEEISFIHLTHEDLNLIQSFINDGYFQKIRVIFQAKDNTYQNMEKNSMELEDKILLLEKKINELKQKIVEQNEEFKNKYKEQNDKFEKKYKEQNEKFEKIINEQNQTIVEQKKEFEKKFKNIKISEDKFKNKEKTYKADIDKLMNQIYEKNQEECENKVIMRNIKERDNYKAIIYTILISIGFSFENIYLDLTRTISFNFPKINQKYSQLINDCQCYLFQGDIDAHESSRTNIFPTLFSKRGYQLPEFTDDILNRVKEVIRGLPLLKSGKIDKDSFMKKMDEITTLIRKNIKN